MILTLTAGMLSGQILVDGLYQDWDSVEVTIDDSGDNAFVDIEEISITNDDEFLFFKIDLDLEIDIQENNAISLFIDADNDASTGFSVNGIGAEISFYFDRRSGFINLDGRSEAIRHPEIGLVVLPTVTSATFEIAVSREIDVNIGKFSMGQEIAISVENSISSPDVVPNSGKLIYNMVDNDAAVNDFSFLKKSDSHVRLVSYNVLRDGLFKPTTRELQRSLLKAVDPDIIAFQEIYDNSARQVAAVMDEILPLESGNWFFAQVFPDIITVSKYPITGVARLDGNGAFRIELDEKEIVLYNIHFPCCENDRDRQQEIDKIMASIRDRDLDPNIGFAFPDKTPVILAGDFNLVGLSEQLNTLYTGDIKFNPTYGPDFAPDYDGSQLEDSEAQTIQLPFTYTWYNVGTSFIPGKLDFVLYTGSVLKKTNAFVLNSRMVDTDSLATWNIGGQDVSTRASDHLPVVVDFSLDIDEDRDGFSYLEDCDDNNNRIFPGAAEIADNGIDEDCDGMDMISVNTTQVLSDQDVRLFPSLTDSYFTVSVEDGIDVGSMVVTDRVGNLILQRSVIGQVEVTTWAAGTYFVTLRSAVGKPLWTGRVVVAF